MIKSLIVTITKCLAAVAPAAILVATLAPPAQARSSGFFHGPLDGSSWSCFSEDSGGVKGTGATGCVGTPLTNSPRFETQLPIDATGTYSVVFGIRGNGALGPNCAAYVVDQLTTTVTGTSPVTNVTTSYVAKTVHTVSVPNAGYLYAACDTLSNSAFRVGSINWTQP